ncbi:MAG TPA: four helix bundle protein [Acidobacteriota bacterium]|jgi:four helix bundle protein
MDQQEMKRRTKEYAKRIIKLCRTLPETWEARRVADQLFRAGTSVGANYRAACRARSKVEFISKLSIVLEETDQSLYWLEIIAETNLLQEKLLLTLMREGNELVTILISTINSSKRSTK